MQQPLWIITTALITGQLCLAISLRQWFRNMSRYENHLEVLVNHELLSPTPSLSEPLRLEWSPRTCISNKPPPGDAGAAGPATTAREPLSRNNLEHIKYSVSSEGRTQQVKSARRTASTHNLRQIKVFPSLVQATSQGTSSLGYIQNTQLSWN